MGFMSPEKCRDIQKKARLFLIAYKLQGVGVIMASLSKLWTFSMWCVENIDLDNV